MPKPRLARPCGRPSLRPRADGTLYCPSCDDIVHDLTRATRSEASRLFHANGGKLCGLVHTYPDGEIRFVPEPPRRGLLAAAGGAAMALALAGCESESDAPATTEVIRPEETPPRESAGDAPDEQPTVAEDSVRAGSAPVVTHPATVDDEVGSPDDADPNGGDASPHRHVHETHRHTHAPVMVENMPLPGGLEGL